MGASPPKLVADLVTRFERNRNVFLSPDYKEEQIRAEFLNPFFESLGGDVSNKPSVTEVYGPVTHEESSVTAVVRSFWRKVPPVVVERKCRYGPMVWHKVAAADSIRPLQEGARWQAQSGR